MYFNDETEMFSTVPFKMFSDILTKMFLHTGHVLKMYLLGNRPKYISNSFLRTF